MSSDGSSAFAYTVFVDDNFHYMDEESRYRLGEFPTCEAAVDACKRIVEESLKELYEPGLDAAAYWKQYVIFGEDPWVATRDPDCTSKRFSAWDYARARCAEICGDDAPP